MTTTLLGPISWSGSRNNEWHRDYKIKWLVETDDPDNDGPEVVSGTTGLPAVGTSWLVGGESDVYAFCRPESDIQPVFTGEPITLFTVDQTFSTRPITDKERQNQTAVDNPLLRPAEISGTFVKYTKEATEDMNGDPILSSSMERIHGAAVERDFNRHQVTIKQVSSTLDLEDYVEHIDTVNDATMWGLAARKIKLSNVSWVKKHYGSSWNSVYYEVTFMFDIDFNGFDRKVLNEGTLEYKGAGDIADPANWKKHLKEGQPAVALYDTGGALAMDKDGTPGVIKVDGTIVTAGDAGATSHILVELYEEKDLLSLGVPSSL